MRKVPQANCNYILQSVDFISAVEGLPEKYFISKTRCKHLWKVCFLKEAAEWEVEAVEIVVCADFTCLLFEYGNCYEELAAWIVIGEFVRA